MPPRSGRRRRRFWVGLLLLAIIVLLVRMATYTLYPLHHWQTLSMHALDYGLDPLLVAAVIRVESGWDPEAVSAPGARGLMQVMPPTAAEVAAQLGLEPFDPDRLFDPDINIRIGTYYLAALRQQFAGQEAAMLAAYNGGARHVHDWLATGRWSGQPTALHQIPFPETREFVRQVLRDRERYEALYRIDGSRRW